MERNLGSVGLTRGEEMLINLVNAIKSKSHADYNEGRENKRLDQWGAELVNSDEYIIAIGKLKADQDAHVVVADEIDI